MVAIVASLHGSNLFSSLPSSPPPKDHSVSPQTTPASPPIPVPIYPPPRKKFLKPQQTPQRNAALKSVHRRTKYFKPVRDGVIASDGDRSVVIGESGVSYHLPGAPFEFQFSYSETPKVKPTAIREPAFLPFAPPTMPRPWTGKAPLKSSKKKIPLFDSFNPPRPGKKGVKHVEMPGPFSLGKYPEEGRTREEILGDPLKKWEIRMLVKPFLSDNTQVNLGRDGLTHNMLELVHTHWKRRRVCKVRCKGVPTLDMDNICHHLEEKTGGKVIHRVGGVVYLFRGRNYNYRTRPQYPVMLWKPAAPVYPKLIQEAPEGLTKAEADDMRKKGKALLPICKLAKNGVYVNLVNDVRYAFEGSPLVKIDCTGMHASDYKKLGAKLKELVPCVLLSFDDEQILMWRGRDWKSIFPVAQPALPPGEDCIGASLKNPDCNASHVIPPGEDCIGASLKNPAETDEESQKGNTKTARTSRRMWSLWNQAIESNKAMLLDEIALGPDALLVKVEEFEGISQFTEHSYPALILSSEGGAAGSTSDSDTEESSQNHSYCSDDDWDPTYNDDDDEDDYEEYEDEDDSFDDFKQSIPHGSLQVDSLAEKLRKKGVRK